MRQMIRTAAPLLVLSLVSGCLADGKRTTLEIEATGAVAAVLYLDLDGNGEYAASAEPVARDLTFAVVRRGGDTITTATTDAGGVGVTTPIPVGSYDLVVAPSELADTLELADSPPVAVVPPNDTAVVYLPLQHATRTIAQVRASTTTMIVAVEGIALNAWSAFGDSTVHVADTTGAVRAIRSRGAAVEAGDSVRVVGRSETVTGDRVLANALLRVTGSGPEPDAEAVSTGEAASADGGAQAAGLVRVENARIVDSRTLPNGDRRLVVDDGSGVLEVLLDRDASISTELAFTAGVRVDAAGVLVRLADDRWQLKPRSTEDIEVRVTTVSIETARAMSAGQTVRIHGVALNGWASFGDGIVHVADATASIRVRMMETSFIEAGDSVQFVGTLSLSAGQPLITSVSSTNFGVSANPLTPQIITTGEAAEARGGELDAALVKVFGARIDAITTVGSDTHVTVDDGTGPVTVILDRDTGISSSGYSTGESIDVQGVLAASGTRWMLKPRSSSDVTRP